MKKVLLAATILCATSVSAQAGEGSKTWPYWYVGLNAGVTHQSDADYDSNGTAGTFEFDSGTQIGGSFGYILPEDSTFGSDPAIGRGRIELEANRRKQDFDNAGSTGEIQADVYTANYFYDFNIDSSVMPYVGAGVGVANIELTPTNAAGADGDDTVPVYQVMAGLGYSPEYAPRTELSVGYKYLAPMNDPEVANTGLGRTEVEFDNHSVEVGAKFRF